MLLEGIFQGHPRTSTTWDYRSIAVTRGDIPGSPRDILGYLSMLGILWHLMAVPDICGGFCWCRVSDVLFWPIFPDMHAWLFTGACPTLWLMHNNYWSSQPFCFHHFCILWVIKNWNMPENKANMNHFSPCSVTFSPCPYRNHVYLDSAIPLACNCTCWWSSPWWVEKTAAWWDQYQWVNSLCVQSSTLDVTCID